MPFDRHGAGAAYRFQAAKRFAGHGSVVDFIALLTLSALALFLLTNPTRGTAKIYATSAAAAVGIYLVTRFSLLYYVRTQALLRAELEQAHARAAMLQAGHQHYVEAIERILDQEGPIYAEHLELTVLIGGNDDEDLIEERRHTAPMPRVTHRAVRPIVPYDANRPAIIDEIAVTCSLSHDSGTITQLPLDNSRTPRVWFVFDPGRTEPFEWTISYRPPRLWRPLRERGYDNLVWTDRIPVGSKGESLLTEFVVRFIFPRGDKVPNVSERHAFGEIAPPAQRADGAWVIVWRDARPSGRRYEWDLMRGLP